MDTKTKIRLGDLGTGHVWFVSTAQPAGCDLIAEDDEPLWIPCEDWWDLEGTVTGNRWEWDGSGSPVDDRLNTVLNIVAFIPNT